METPVETAVSRLWADKITNLRVLKKRQTIYLQGDAPDWVYLLKAGRVKISSCTPNGKELIVAILKPGDLFGLVEAWNGSPREAQAEALEDVVLGVIQRDDFMQHLRERPDLALELVEILVCQLQKLQVRVQELALPRVSARLAHLLLDLGQDTSLPGSRGLKSGVKLTHQDIANVLACSRETVTQLLGEFHRQGLIRKNRRSITILNVAELAQMCAEAFGGRLPHLAFCSKLNLKSTTRASAIRHLPQQIRSASKNWP